MASVYVASKSCHGPKWLDWREVGVPICSTWIDEWAPGASPSEGRAGGGGPAPADYTRHSSHEHPTL